MINLVIDQNLPNITSKVEGRKRLKKLRSRDTKDITESSDEEFPVTNEKNRHAKYVLWCLIQQMSKQRFSMISSAMNPIGMPKIINIVGENMFCGEE